jgi:hypothetical protein
VTVAGIDFTGLLVTAVMTLLWMTFWFGVIQVGRDSWVKLKSLCSKHRSK